MVYKAPQLHFGGGGGGGGVDTETKNYVDAKIETVRAQNDAKFTEVIAEIRAIVPGATWQQNAVILFAAIGFVFAILAFASDRFDGGLSANSLKDQIASEQVTRDAVQDEKLNKIITEIGRIQPAQ